MKLKEAVPRSNTDRRQPTKVFPKHQSVEKRLEHLEQRIDYMEQSLDNFLSNLSRMVHGVDSEIKKDIGG